MALNHNSSKDGAFTGIEPATTSVPLVSVLIPAYNCQAYIGTAIESVLDRQGVSVEIIVVDDGSKDQTVQIAQSYTTRGPVRVFVNESNRGVSYSRNRAILEARGEWLALLDADDWFAPDRLATLIEKALQTNADLVADDMFLVDDGTRIAYSTRLTDINALFRDDTWIGPTQFALHDLGSTKPLMRRQFIMGNALFYPEDVRYGEDFLQLLHALLAGGRLLLVPTPMYHLRRGNTGSATTNRPALTSQVATRTRQLLADPAIASDEELYSALQRRLSHVTDLALLSEFVSQANVRNISAMLFQALRQPAFLVALARRSVAVVATRIRRRRQRKLLNTATRPPLTNE